jgi:hypothetical protein
LFIGGKKRYFINAVDLFEQVAFSYEYLRLNSEKAKDFLSEEDCPFEIKRNQTDNGNEFADTLMNT